MLRSLLPMYLLAGVRFITPVFVLPLMASRLGADSFAELSLALIWAGLLSLWVEGGFLGSATRYAVTGNSDCRRALAQQVFSARVASSGAVFVVAFAVGSGYIFDSTLYSPGTCTSHALTLALLACAMGWPSTWYWQATGQLHCWAVVELGIQLALVFSYFAWAHSVLGFLLLQAVANLVTAFAGWWWMRRQLSGDGPWRLWSPLAVEPGLALGWQMLPMSLVGTAYTLGLPAIAATQMSPRDLGVFFLADRLVRALMAAVDPITQLVYLRIVQRLAVSPKEALRYTLRWSALGLSLGLTLVAALATLWPYVSGAIRGVNPSQLADVLMVLIWLVPLSMGWRFIGYWMLGSGHHDRTLRWCIVAGAFVGVAGAFMFGHNAGHLAWVAVLAELAVMIDRKSVV